MNGSRILGAACASLLLGALATATQVGCGSAEAEKPEGVTAQSVQAASVSLTLHDASGARIGEGSGILIAPRVVLTAGHLVAGKAKWTVTSADGKTKVTGTRGLTYDWMPYNSNKSHPRKHDIGVLYLDAPIQLAAYPTLSSEVLANGASASRVRSTGASFELEPGTYDRLRTFPHAYITELGARETVTTGGAILNDKNEIVGIVSGRGMTTGKLYVARVNQLVAWLSPKVACGGKAATALSTRTYGVPTAKDDCDAGDEGSSGSSGASGGTAGSSGSSGASGGTAGSSGSSGGGTNGVGGPDGNCNDGPGGFLPDGQPYGGGIGGAGGGGGAGDGSGTGGGGGAGSGGTNGAQGAGGTGGGGGSTGGGGELCSGPNDNPEICPPEPDGFASPTAGGGSPDDTMDYGGCGTCGSADGNPIVK